MNRLSGIFPAFAALVFFHLISAHHAFCSSYDELQKYLYPEEETISMDFQGANLSTVLKVFSQQSEMNFIASNDVASTRITLFLKNVPLEEALQKILEANNFTYELQRENNIVIVKRSDAPQTKTITRVFPLKHITLPSSVMNSTLSEFEDAEVTAVNDEVGIVETIHSILTPYGKLTEDTRTNSLIVTDLPGNFKMIGQTIARLDVRVPQILIEAEMLDVSKSSADLLGAKFGDTPLTFSGASRATLHPFDQDNIARDSIPTPTPGTLNDLLEDFVGEGGGEGAFTAGQVSFAGLSFIIQFLRSQSDTRNLARPRILTLNNQRAEIRISTDEAIGVTTQTSEVGGAAEATREAERTRTGVFLTVTPQANVETREITMAIEPKVIQANQSSGFVEATNFKDPEERAAKSILRVKDGDTIIIGGLLRSNTQDARTNVPFLSRVPLVGAAFRHKDKSESERELIIFITPHILKEDGADFYPTTTAMDRQLIREQDHPSGKYAEINRELSLIEQQEY